MLLPLLLGQPKAYTLTAQGGTYTLTGSTTTISRHRFLTAQSGSYTLLGQSATILKSRRIEAQGGTYFLIGSDALITISDGLIEEIRSSSSQEEEEEEITLFASAIINLINQEY